MVDLTHRYCSCYSATLGEPARLRQEVEPGLCVRRLLQRTSMRRHYLSRSTWRPLCGGCNGSLCPSRYASIRTFGELTLVARCIMGSVLIRALPRRCDLLSGLPGRVDQVRSRSRLQRSEAPAANNGRGHQPPWRRLAALWRYLHLLRARLCSIASLFKLPPLALGADACCGADRIPLP